jgi:hypothetical protein
VLVVAASSWASGCSPDERSELLLPSEVVRGRPLDTTKPNEIAESEIFAFGLALPRGLRIKAQAKDATYAIGRLPFEALANYVRDRVTATRVDTGPAQTVFVDAIVKRDPKHVVQVEVRARRGRVELVVRDRTPKPADEGLTEAERWRRAGLTPDGRPIEKLAE